ncbi:MAG: hypothetical protein QE271_04645 [Bacteriovoracaceae bacterium]|nr:hypothetical protein [Bacteriovoracaceae bacterium]
MLKSNIHYILLSLTLLNQTTHATSFESLKSKILSLSAKNQLVVEDSMLTNETKSKISKNLEQSYSMTALFAPEEMLNAFASRYNVKFVKDKVDETYDKYDRPLFTLPDIDEANYYDTQAEAILKISLDLKSEFTQNAVKGVFIAGYYKNDLEDLWHKVVALPDRFRPQQMINNVIIVNKYFKSMEDIGIKITRFVNDDKVTYEFDQNYFQNYYSADTIEELPIEKKSKILAGVDPLFDILYEFHNSEVLNKLIGYNELKYFHFSIINRLKEKP